MNPHLLPQRGEIPHFLPEGGNENSPGWSPPQRTRSWESVPSKSLRPVGAERDNFMPLPDVLAIPMNQTRCPVFGAWMNYDFKVEELSSALTVRRANALTPHRLFDSPSIQKKAAFFYNDFFKDEGQNPKVSACLSQPAKPL
jgi:hypothetical protein